MWTTFLVALKANLRNRQALFWMIVFPIVLATMFNGFFGGLSEGYELKPIPMAVVEDSRWQQADGARTFVDALSGETASSSESLDGTAYADINQQLRPSPQPTPCGKPNSCSPMAQSAATWLLTATDVWR